MIYTTTKMPLGSTLIKMAYINAYGKHSKMKIYMLISMVNSLMSALFETRLLFLAHKGLNQKGMACGQNAFRKPEVRF